MAEAGELEGLLGADREGTEAASGLTGADAAAMAVAIDQTRHDPELSRKVGAYVDEQRQLVRLQVKHFDEEHRLSIAAAKRKRYADRIRNALATILAIAAASALVGLGAMLWDATHDHGLVVEAFSVPPDFPEKGLTGQVVASDVLEQIDDLQAHTNSGRALETFKNKWGDDVKVAIPETGVSIGDLSRILHERLGHATRVEGSVTHTGSAISVTTRIPGHSSIRVSGAEADLEALVRQVALGIFADTQPYRYAVWLTDQDRAPESAAVFRKIAEDGPADERAWGWNGLGLTEDRFEDSLADFRRSIQADPDMVMANWNIARTCMSVGFDEAALGAARAGLQANRGRGRAKLKPYAADVDDQRLNYVVSSELGDHLGAAKFAHALNALPRWGGSKEEGHEFEALESVLAHDPQSAVVASMPSDLEETRASNASLELHGRDEAYVSITRLLLAADSGAWQEVVVNGEALRVAIAQQPFLFQFKQQVPRRVFPILALAYEHLGRSGDADALAKEIPNDVYGGWRARGRIAVLRHDYPAAEKAVAEAVRQAPSVPHAYSDWGDVLAAKNDPEGAIAKYTEANRRGPHFADPIKAWGDVLAKQGHWKQALIKYDEAIRYAPNWKQLKDAREAAAKHAT